MKVIAIANPAGGCGQTTTVVSLAGALASEGFAVLVVEADPRANISAFFKSKTIAPHVLADLFSNVPVHLDEISASDTDAPVTGSLSTGPLDTKHLDTESLVGQTGVENIQLIQAGEHLNEAVAATPGRHGAGLILRTFLDRLDGQQDYVLIGCPTDLKLLMVNAIAACTTMIIPVPAGSDNPDAVASLLNLVQMIEKSKAKVIKKIVLPTRHDDQAENADDAITVMKQAFGEDLWSGFIPVDSKFGEALEQSVPIVAVDAKTPGAVAYRQLLSTLT
tara:strand:+ start:6940 stop:7770 length:831 start_codon:yes stop_codon:yes gene_type:complete